jgi:hypothetical protein
MVPLEIEDVPHIRSAPRVDRLVWISDDAQVAVVGGELLYEAVLDSVGVLVLVDEDVLEAALVVAQHLREALEELDRLEQQIAEVEGTRVGEEALVAGVELRGALGLEVGASTGRCASADASDRPPWGRGCCA